MLGLKGYQGFEQQWQEERNDPNKATKLHLIPDIRRSNYCLPRAPRDKNMIKTLPPELIDVSKNLVREDDVPNSVHMKSSLNSTTIMVRNEMQAQQNELFSPRQEGNHSSVQMRSNLSSTKSIERKEQQGEKNESTSTRQVDVPSSEETYCCLYILSSVLAGEKVVCATATVYLIRDGILHFKKLLKGHMKFYTFNSCSLSYEYHYNKWMSRGDYAEPYAISVNKKVPWSSERLLENKELNTIIGACIAHQDNILRINRGTGYDNQRVVNVAGARENVEQADWRDDPDDEPDDQELEAHYMYMAHIQEVTPDAADNYVPIFDIEPLETIDQDDDDLAKNCDLLASLIENIKCEIDDSKNRNNLLESLNKTLVDKFKAMSRTDRNDKAFKENQSKVFLKEREQYFEIQDLKAQLQDKGIAKRDLKKLIEKLKGKSVETKFEKPSVIRQPNAFESQKHLNFRPQLKSNQLEDRVMPNNSQGKKQNLEDHQRNFKFSNNKTFVTACNESLNTNTLNVNFVCVTCGECMRNDNRDMCVLPYINDVNSRTEQLIIMPISRR
uniref:Uncharacterized protein n=1 Tax=Tanacetum cinerariifolium TaxID=118510 RepID=A0A6L2K4E9_TANCI|nr:hypothetical protein [Tanacetum cinerariifolium]